MTPASCNVETDATRASAAAGTLILLILLQLVTTAWLSKDQQGAGPESGATAIESRAHLLPLRLDPNSATSAELALLPGIGPTLAARIVEFRVTSAAEGKTPFRSLLDLDQVPGIGPGRLAALADLVEFPPILTIEREHSSSNADFDP